MIKTTPEKFSLVKLLVSFNIVFYFSSKFCFSFIISEILKDFSYKVKGHMNKSKMSKG